MPPEDENMNEWIRQWNRDTKPLKLHDDDRGDDDNHFFWRPKKIHFHTLANCTAAATGCLAPVGMEESASSYIREVSTRSETQLRDPIADFSPFHWNHNTRIANQKGFTASESAFPAGGFRIKINRFFALRTSVRVRSVLQPTLDSLPRAPTHTRDTHHQTRETSLSSRRTAAGCHSRTVARFYSSVGKNGENVSKQHSFCGI